MTRAVLYYIRYYAIKDTTFSSLVPDPVWRGVAPEALLPGPPPVLAPSPVRPSRSPERLVPVQMGQDAVGLLSAETTGGGGSQFVLRGGIMHYCMTFQCVAGTIRCN